MRLYRCSDRLLTPRMLHFILSLDAFSDPLDHHRGAKRREEIRPATTSQKAQSQNKTVGTSDWKQSTVAARWRHAQSFCREWGNGTEQPSRGYSHPYNSQHWLLDLLVFFLRVRWSCRTSWRRSETTPRITSRSTCTTWGTSCTGCWRSSSVNLWVNWSPLTYCKEQICVSRRHISICVGCCSDSVGDSNYIQNQIWSRCGQK